ncbi:OLC1v1030690C1 [Oldenlandia corymbosa var. corymbosa]|uniref:OLC1v1030690C1 n=1 Tax=Oldenlandia corymbosa var. corymbosa TaxID=529605 RepID=A0AAV1CII5_OLDCO|nr:OLC1v1030690C1 [Oldenlandia corymbosa var. corymbosa]
MDGCSGKRNRSGTVVPRRACSLVMRDSTDTKDLNSQFCNRIGCSGRLKYRSGPLDSAEKAKFSRPSVNSSNGKEVARSSSKNCCTIARARNSAQDSPRKFSSHLESLQSKPCFVQDESHIAKVNPRTGRGRNYQAQLQPKLRASSTRLVMPGEEGSLCTGLKDASKRVPCHKPQSGCHNVPSGSSVSSTDSGISTNRNSISGSCNGSRNLKSDALSNIIPRGGSSSESRNGSNLLKKRMPVGESSSYSRVKREVASSKDEHNSPSTSCTSFSIARRNRNGASTHGNIGSPIQTRRSANANSRILRSNHETVTSFPVTECQSNIPGSPRSEVCNNAYHASSSRSSLAGSSIASSSHATPEQIGDSVPRTATLTSTEHGVAQGLRRHHLNGAAEVLLALERIEQDEELTYEVDHVTFFYYYFMCRLAFYVDCYFSLCPSNYFYWRTTCSLAAFTSMTNTET